VGPEHLLSTGTCGRIEFEYATDDEVLEVFRLCIAPREGIISGLGIDPCARLRQWKRARELGPDRVIVVNLSGRGDKDVQQVQRNAETKQT